MSRSTLVAPDVLTQAARRLPIVLILDWSWSMRHHRTLLTELVPRLPAAFDRRTVLRTSGDVAVITVNHEGVLLRTGTADTSPFGFVRARDLVTAYDVVTEGTSPLHLALDVGVTLVEHRAAEIVAAGRSMFRPYIAIISDGVPTNSRDKHEEAAWNASARRAAQALEGRLFLEAFVPHGCAPGRLSALVGEDGVRTFTPDAVAEVIEAVSYSAEHGAARVRPHDRVREDLQPQPRYGHPEGRPS